MADLYENFAYAQITATLAAGSPGDVLDIPVDTTGRLPSVADLATGDFWMTIESDLASDTFEIVKVLSYPNDTTVRVLRGQDGAGAPGHLSGAYLKGSITAAMLRRLGSYRRFVDLGNLAIKGTSGLPAPAIYWVLKASWSATSGLSAAVGISYGVAAQLAGSSGFGVQAPEYVIKTTMGGSSGLGATITVAQGKPVAGPTGYAMAGYAIVPYSGGDPPVVAGQTQAAPYSDSTYGASPYGG